MAPPDGTTSRSGTSIGGLREARGIRTTRLRKRVMVDAEIDATRQFLASSRRLAGLSERRKWLDAGRSIPAAEGCAGSRQRTRTGSPRARDSDAGVFVRYRRSPTGLHLVQFAMGQSGGRRHNREGRGRSADPKIQSDGTCRIVERGRSPRAACLGGPCADLRGLHPR